MFLQRLKFDVLALSFGGLIFLLLLAGIFMHRWINRASEGERREKQEQLAAALHGTVKDFTAALRDLPDLNGEAKSPTQLDGWVSQQYQRWRAKASQPEIIRSVSIGKLSQHQEADFYRLDSANAPSAFVKAEWPEAFASLRTDLLSRAQQKTLQPMPPEAVAQVQGNKQLFLVLPLTISIQPPLPARFSPPKRKFQLPSMEPPPMEPPPDRRRRPEGPPPFVRQRWEEQRKRMEERQKQIETEMQKERQETERRVQALRNERPRIEQLAGFCFLELDTDYLRNQYLPSVIAQHFKSTELSNYHVAVVIEPEQQAFFATDANNPLSTFDAQEALFQGEAKAWRGNAPVSLSQLTLRVRHKAGSLQTVMDRTRWRNLALGYGILLLLFASASTLLIATHRARTLAQRQMEFVAGVTHELRTPLTAIQAAGFNLSSGRVNDGERVKQYGTMIHTEGRRLADLIDQVLSYARIETNRKSGENSYNFQSVEVDGIIEQALSEYKAAFADWQIEKDIEADLPPIKADANVLASALKNLLQNALKYAEQGKWLRIRAARVKGEVQITIADQGPGIERRDLPHIFAPFYRAQKMVASTVPGTGLGLSLVNEYMKAHHGRVTVDSTVGKGSAFTLHLPIHARNGKPV